MKSKGSITLDEAELILDKQLRKLELVDEGDQKSYKITDYLLRTTDSIEGVVSLKIKIENMRQKADKRK